MPELMRSSPALIRPSLEMAQKYSKVGIMFVAVPVFSYEDMVELQNMARKRLAEAEEQATAAEKADPNFKA